MEANNRNLIKKLFGYIVKDKPLTDHMRMDMFDWPQGVALYGIYRAWEATRDVELKEYLDMWTKKYIKDAYKSTAINANAPLLTYIKLYKENNDTEYLKVCTDIGGWILDNAPRTKAGGFEHTVVDKNFVFKEQMWADTLFMACIFLAEMGAVTGDIKYTKEAQNQLFLHHKYLKDPATGLFYHGWNCKTSSHMSGALWGRANAWVTVSTVEMLNIFEGDFEGRDFILKSLKLQIEGLERVQEESGTFHTVLDRKDTYEETSCAAGFAAGIKRGIKFGYIDKKYANLAEKAQNAVIERINDEGVLLGVSGGTPIMESIEAYNSIERLPTLYGQALALLMLCE